MPIFLDLDNTLVDRDEAFRRWARDLMISWGGDEPDFHWLIQADASGYTPRVQVAQMILDRFNPPVGGVNDLVDQLLYEHVEYIECYPGVLAELQRFKDAGVPLVIVTNGEAQQQRMKLRRTGLDQVISGSIISSDLGFKKPDARMFAAAQALVSDGGSPWMVGDHIEADIAGARTAGCSTAWVSHHRRWTKEWQPTLMADQTTDLLALLHETAHPVR